MIRIQKANLLGKNKRKQMIKLFVDSYYHYFSFYCSDKNKLYKAFHNCFCFEKFYCALLDNEVIGIGACSDGFCSSIKLNKFRMYCSLGVSLGKSMYKYLRMIFIDKDYAFEIDNECGMLEFITVNEVYRDKKIGYTLTNHIMCDNDYKRYLAKIADNNSSARKILDNIGFEIFDEESATGLEKKNLNINNYLYMICDNPRLRG